MALRLPYPSLAPWQLFFGAARIKFGIMLKELLPPSRFQTENDEGGETASTPRGERTPREHEKWGAGPPVPSSSHALPARPPTRVILKWEDFQQIELIGRYCSCVSLALAFVLSLSRHAQACRSFPWHARARTHNLQLSGVCLAGRLAGWWAGWWACRCCCSG